MGREIYSIINDMAEVLNASQLQKLQEVLVKRLSENESASAQKLATDITQKLSEAVQEIGVTLNLISDISLSTNLLALNASVEAARAGKAGRGFAVVGTEAGNLANSTQESLKIVQEVIERVQQNVKDITMHVEGIL